MPGEPLDVASRSPYSAASRLPLIASLAVALLSAMILTLGTERIPMTAAYQDRTSQIRSQDEATYSRVALEMRFGGRWLTPRLLGRFFLYKPPLLYWLSALSVRILGVSRLALRFPSVIAGSIGVALVFAWCCHFGSWMHGSIAAVLMLSNSTWQTMSRLACMDVLLACAILTAVFFLARDPSLARRSSVLGFGAGTAAAIMTKSIAGAIPVLVLCAFTMVARTGERPSLRRAIAALGVAFLLAAPWHLYQLLFHQDWFLAEYVKTQLFGFGSRPVVQAREGAVWFYSRRLLASDPVLAVLFVAALARLFQSVRRRAAGAVLLAVWLAVTLLAVGAFQSRSFLYAVLLIPALSLAGASCLPLPRRLQPVVLALLIAIGIGKCYANAPWDLAFYRVATPSPQLSLRSYADRGRANELIVVQPDDEFYAMLLPIHGLRYCWIGPVEPLRNYAPHLFDLGITMPSAQFIDYDKVQAVYADRLRQWHLSSADPIATSIVAPSPADVLRVIDARPTGDFYLPARILDGVGDRISTTHSIEPASAGRVFLLARSAPMMVRPNPIPSWARGL